jgi:hypothetical protein
MAGESSKERGSEQVESLIDELISDIFSEPRTNSGTSMPGMATAGAIFEGALGPGRLGTTTSMLERLVLAEAFASELADALAPALAEQLAPRLITALEQYVADGSAAKKPAPRTRSSQARKADGK